MASRETRRRAKRGAEPGRASSAAASPGADAAQERAQIPPPPSRAAGAAEAASGGVADPDLATLLRALPAPDADGFTTWRPEPAPAAAPAATTERVGVTPTAGAEGPPPSTEADQRGTPAPDALDRFFYRPDEAPAPLLDLGLPSEPDPAATAPVPVDEYLTFLLGAEEYALAVGHVREVLRPPPITEVPRAPAHVLGVVTVRGEVVAVFDPRGRLGVLAAGPAAPGRIVIVDGGAGRCGLAVDAVRSVVRVPAGALEPPPPGRPGLRIGTGRHRGRPFIVVDVAALLRDGTAGEGRADVRP